MMDNADEPISAEWIWPQGERRDTGPWFDGEPGLRPWAWLAILRADHAARRAEVRAATERSIASIATFAPAPSPQTPRKVPSIWRRLINWITGEPIDTGESAHE